MNSPNAAFGIYLAVFLLYFLACWPISLLAQASGKEMEVVAMGEACAAH